MGARRLFLLLHNINAQYRSNQLCWYCGGTNGFSTERAITENYITLTADPFVNAVGFNFLLNTTAGAGALIRALTSVVNQVPLTITHPWATNIGSFETTSVF
jgi:hypothetical protein